MTRPKPLTQEEVLAALSSLPEWQLEDGRLHRTFKLANFVEALDFMTRVGRHAEELDHHPDWRNCYSTVEVWLDSHDVGALTVLDVELARRMNAEAAAS
jgi:4a-hydroxytetrahydrobiopterin dehydratase